MPTKGNGPYPLVLFIHGGGWYSGDKHQNMRYVFPLVDRGFVVASMNYRLTNEAIWPAQMNDVKAAIRYLRENAPKYKIDSDHVGVWGMSAGGHLAAMAGTAGDVAELDIKQAPGGTSTKVQAVVDWFGPTDFTHYASGELVLAKNVDWMVERLFGGPVLEKKEVAKSASAVAYVTSDDPPTLIMHGTADDVVPFAQSEYLEKALKGVGVNVKLVSVKDAGHVLFPQEYFEQVAQFFETYLKGPAKTAASSPQATPLQTP